MKVNIKHHLHNIINIIFRIGGCQLDVQRREHHQARDGLLRGRGPPRRNPTYRPRRRGRRKSGRKVHHDLRRAIPAQISGGYRRKGRSTYK